MKKTAKLISALLVLVLSITTLSSCGLIDYVIGTDDGDNEGANGLDGNHKNQSLFPKGYTGGFPYADQPGNEVEFWWVETYEECLAAIELLKSHGSTFEESAIFTYDGELFDTKYCFKISGTNKYTEDIEFGDNPFDRRAGDVEIKSYAFFDDVTIDEINYSDVSDYCPDCIIYIFDKDFREYCKENIRYEWYEHSQYFIAFDIEKDTALFSFSSFGYSENPEKAELCINEMINSIRLVGYEDVE